MRSSQFFALVLFSSLLFGQSCLAHPAGLINEICKKNEGVVSFKFCLASFKSDPKAQSATIQDDLGELSFQHLISKASEISTKIPTIEKTNPNHHQALQNCSKLYAEAKPMLEEALNRYSIKDYPTSRQKLMAAMMNSFTCAHGFRRGDTSLPDFQRMNTDFIELATISLSFVRAEPVPKAKAEADAPKVFPKPVSAAAGHLASLVQGKKSPFELGAVAVQSLVSKSAEINSAISQLLKDPKTTPDAKEALQYCSTSYSGFHKSLMAGLKGYLTKHYEDLQGTMDTLTLDAEYCVDEFSNHNLVFPLMKQQTEFVKMAEAAAESLSFLPEA